MIVWFWFIVFLVACMIALVGLWFLMFAFAQSWGGFQWAESGLLIEYGCILLIVGIGVAVLVWHLGLLPAPLK